jgi:16S rRNA (cytosine1402-N4)-methyltransferase
VLLREVLDHLQPAAGKVIADVTLGHGGHTRAIIDRMAGTGTMIVMDLDGSELARTLEELPATGTKLISSQGNFAGIPQVLGEHGLLGIDGVLADLGVTARSTCEWTAPVAKQHVRSLRKLMKTLWQNR